ncbi:MAG: EFR1 family ferrodoxin [Candidatus Lokiarchaeota archaeon]|nr:EFR1 family ferrodoxin [Candidatus Lokiarchaeota archaeon]
MLNIGIFYFSGTGNTKVITKLIGDAFKKKCKCDIIRIEDLLKNKRKINLCKYDLIGIGNPIYGFDIPKNIFNFFKKYNFIDKQKIFIYSTCAGPFCLNDIASFNLKKVIKKKGLKLIYEELFYMSSNIVFRYNDEVIKQLYNCAVIRSKKMVDNILLGKKKIRSDKKCHRFFRWILSFEKLAWKIIPMDFRVKKICNLCGLCVKNCPQNNIYTKNNKIRFGYNCLACYRCVYGCPLKAITLRYFKFSIVKGGYNIEKILRNPKTSANYITDKTKGYYKIFYNYIKES